MSLENDDDEAIWEWTPSKVYTVKSMYEHLTRDDNGTSFSYIWKNKVHFTPFKFSLSSDNSIN
jgi:hypothetical protein